MIFRGILALARRVQEAAESIEAMRSGVGAHEFVSVWIQEAMEKLPENLRLTAYLVRVVGLSHKEAGAVLGVAAGTISWRTHKAEMLWEGLYSAGQEELS